MLLHVVDGIGVLCRAFFGSRLDVGVHSVAGALAGLAAHGRRGVTEGGRCGGSPPAQGRPLAADRPHIGHQALAARARMEYRGDAVCSCIDDG